MKHGQRRGWEKDISVRGEHPNRDGFMSKDPEARRKQINIG